MRKPIGPTIPRWRLGEQLMKMRDAAGLSQADIATQLGCSVSKIQKIEAGDVGVVRGELLLMLDAYRVDNPTLRDELTQLQRLGKQRGWWSKFGQVPPQFATFLGLENAATGIHIFEPLMVTGLLQTEEYARAITVSADLIADDQAQRHVQLRIERQQQVFSNDPPTTWVILDEAAIRRQVGGPEIMANQLRHLLNLDRGVTLQIVPFTQGAYPGVRGPLTIFEFDDQLHSPVAFCASHAGNLYMERSNEVDECYVTFRHMAAAALSKPESLRLIEAAAHQYEQLITTKQRRGASVEH